MGSERRYVCSVFLRISSKCFDFFTLWSFQDLFKAHGADAYSELEKKKPGRKYYRISAIVDTRWSDELKMFEHKVRYDGYGSDCDKWVGSDEVIAVDMKNDI